MYMRQARFDKRAMDGPPRRRVRYNDAGSQKTSQGRGNIRRKQLVGAPSASARAGPNIGQAFNRWRAFERALPVFERKGKTNQPKARSKGQGRKK